MCKASVHAQVLVHIKWFTSTCACAQEVLHVHSKGCMCTANAGSTCFFHWMRMHVCVDVQFLIKK